MLCLVQSTLPEEDQDADEVTLRLQPRSDPALGVKRRSIITAYWKENANRSSGNASTMAMRLQRSRRKGARLPREAIVVTRPTKWGNPNSLSLGRTEATRRYRDDLIQGRLAITVEDVRRELRGRDLACYCPLDEPCHADVLIDVANQ